MLESDARLRSGEKLAVALSRVGLDELDSLEAQIPGVIEDRDREYLHRFRVALRRSRALLKTLEPFLSAAAQGHKEALKWLAGATGLLRDLDVHELEMASWAQPDSALEAVLAEIQRERGVAHANLSELLAGQRCRDVLAGWRQFLLALPRESCPASSLRLRQMLPGLLKSLCRRMRKRGGRIGPSSADSELHRLRIHGKRLRYTLEAFAPVLSRRGRVQRLLGALKDLQTVLGDHQDQVVAADYFRVLARRPGLFSPALFESGRWVRELELRQQASRSDFPRHFAGFARASRRAFP